MPCTLVRLAGCPLQCTYCDTEAAIAPDSGKRQTIDSIVRHVRRCARPLVLVTGGEPLAQRNCIHLLAELCGLDAEIQVETSGAYDISSIPPPVRRIIDIKTPDSGEMSRIRWANLDDLRDGDELKFVLCSRNDYEWSKSCVRQRQLEGRGIPILFSPAWGRISPSDLSRWLLEDRLNVRLHLQLHKYIWGDAAVGV